MQRIAQQRRPDWEAKVEEVGFLYHTPAGEPYWNEEAAYCFSLAQIHQLESATETLHRLALEAVEAIISRDLFHLLGLPRGARELILDSWQRHPRQPSLYGRFDFAWNGTGEPKLLEYNADTPTALLEAAVVQWQWLEECHPGRDQFNSLHERLIARWRLLRTHGVEELHLAALESEEDLGNLRYLGNTAAQAGIAVQSFLRMEEIGWNGENLTDLEERPIRNLFKLYPWEWLLQDEFARHLTKVRILEPAWKMLLSNKALLPLLWQLNPGHPNLLEASFSPLAGDYVAKPFFSREGQNISIHRSGRAPITTTGTALPDEPRIYQRHYPLPCFHGYYPVLGSWIVGDEPAGMGIREDRSPITGNLSRFTPHFIA